MNIKEAYQPRPIRFLELYQHEDWTLKIYSISKQRERVDAAHVEHAKTYLSEWLAPSSAYGLETYKLATLIVHEGKEGCFAIINWWTDDNMLQNFAYLKQKGEKDFTLFSDRGIALCVWEMEVCWHERKAWIKHVLMQHEHPDVEAYLNDHLNSERQHEPN